MVRRPPRGVPGHLDLEDPLPRGRGAAEPAADTRRLPAVQRARRRAARDDPAAAAGRVPAAAGDPRRARDAGRGRAEAPPAGGRGGAGGADRLRGALPPGRRARRSSPRSWRSSGCWRPSARARTSAIPRRTPTSPIVCAQLTRFGVDARHLRTFRTTTDRRGVPARAADRAGAPLAQPRTTCGGAERPAGADRARAGADGAAPLARGARGSLGLT